MTFYISCNSQWERRAKMNDIQQDSENNRRSLYHATSAFGPADVMSLVRKAVDDFDFDHRQWSLWNAQTLETLARMIRDGHSVGTESGSES